MSNQSTIETQDNETTTTTTTINGSNQIDQVADSIKSNTLAEMNEIKNERNYETTMHKDQLIESTNYLCQRDVYELFKMLTFNLVLKKPNDPIRNMIDELKKIQKQQQQQRENQN